MRQQKMLVSVFQKPKQGNTYCGDSYYYNETEDQFICALADGLGSGEYARESSQAVIDVIKENNHLSVEEIIEQSNKILMGKRGVVLGVLKLDFTSNTFFYSSIGNIGMMIVSSDKERKRTIPSSGYLAGFKRPIKVTQFTLDKGTTFIMFSDGVSSKELTSHFFVNHDVEDMIKTYELTTAKHRQDDTTLIAMHYGG